MVVTVKGKTGFTVNVNKITSFVESLRVVPPPRTYAQIGFKTGHAIRKILKVTLLGGEFSAKRSLYSNLWLNQLPQVGVGIQEMSEGVSFNFKFTAVSRQIFDDSAAEMGTVMGDTHFRYACFANFGRRR